MAVVVVVVAAVAVDAVATAVLTTDVTDGNVVLNAGYARERDRYSLKFDEDQEIHCLEFRLFVSVSQ